MPLNGYSKEIFDEAPVKTKFGILYDLNDRILKQLDKHPTNCEERFFAMEKDIKTLSRWKIVGSVVSICSAIGISAGITMAYIKGWIFLIKD